LAITDGTSAIRSGNDFLSKMGDYWHREPCYSERHDGMVLALGRTSRQILTVTTRESRQRINQAQMEADAARP
jgi:hypothetical protein